MNRTNYLIVKKEYFKFKKKYKQITNTYTITVKQPWFNFIKNGEKTVEGRLNVGLFNKLNIGNKIIWMNQNLKCETLITFKHKYSSFKEMLEKETLEKTLPSINNIDDGVKVYRRYYSEDKEKQYGVVAIGLKVV